MSATYETLDVLKGEGETVTITKVRHRHECSVCGEPAHFKHTYLLPNARRNVASSGYGRDDITWCSDHDEYTCRTCKQPKPMGYGWCATFGAIEGYEHMFLYWHEKKS